MKINFDYAFKDENGNPIVIGAEKSPATLKSVAVISLLHAPDKGQGLKEKRLRYDLAARIKTFGSEAVLDKEEITLIQEMIGEVMVPLVVGQACAILEGLEPPHLV